MNRVDLLSFCQANNPRNIQVRFYGAFPGTHLIGLVGLEAVQGKPVFLRIDGHGAQAKLVGSAKDANGDFAAVGSQQFANWFHFPHLGPPRSPKFYIVPQPRHETETVFSMHQMQRLDAPRSRCRDRALSRAPRGDEAAHVGNQSKLHRFCFRTADAFQKSAALGSGLFRGSPVPPQPAVTSVAGAVSSCRSCACTFAQALALRLVAYGASGSA